MRLFVEFMIPLRRYQGNKANGVRLVVWLTTARMELELGYLKVANQIQSFELNADGFQSFWTLPCHTLFDLNHESH